MSNWDIYQYSRDLSNFIQLLRDYEVPMEITELANLDSYLQYNGDKFHVVVENVLFNIDKKISGTIPPNVGYLEILFTHKCEIDHELDEESNDPVTLYDFQLHIKGYDDDMKEYVNWWHLDKNIESDTPKFTHPYYHFQAGGNEIETVDSGDLILLGAPRLPHPPMDLFLGFHFILNNFYSSKDYDFVNELKEDIAYQEIIKRSQQRMWDNYFKAFSEDSHNHFTRQNVFPLYIGNE
jgi:hypothetical protein